MRLQIGKWGNSLAVRLPAALIKKATLMEGDVMEAEVKPDGTLYLAPARHFDKKAFLARLDKLHNSLSETKSVIDLLRQEQRY